MKVIVCRGMPSARNIGTFPFLSTSGLDKTGHVPFCTGTEGDGMDANGSTSPSGGPEKLDGRVALLLFLAA